MPGKKRPIKQPAESQSPNWYALKETAKEMWNAEDFVPAKKKLITKIREAGPAEEPYESPKWAATKELAAEVADEMLPDNPTQLAAGLAGGKVAGSAIKAGGKLIEKGVEKAGKAAAGIERRIRLRGLLKKRAEEQADKAAFRKHMKLNQEARDMVNKGFAEDEDEALEILTAPDRLAEYFK